MILLERQPRYIRQPLDVPYGRAGARPASLPTPLDLIRAPHPPSGAPPLDGRRLTSGEQQAGPLKPAVHGRHVERREAGRRRHGARVGAATQQQLHAVAAVRGGRRQVKSRLTGGGRSYTWWPESGAEPSDGEGGGQISDTSGGEAHADRQSRNDSTRWVNCSSMKNEFVNSISHNNMLSSLQTLLPKLMEVQHTAHGHTASRVVKHKNLPVL